MARTTTKRKSVKTKAKKAGKKVARKEIKKAVRSAVPKAKKKAAKRKSTAKRGARTVASTYDTAMATLTHYIEKGGKNLSDAGKATLEAAREVIHDVSTKISKSTA